MMTSQPVFRCDVPGCMSTCTLAPSQGPTAAAELAKRGWVVLPPAHEAGGVGADRHACPGCKSAGKAPA